MSKRAALLVLVLLAATLGVRGETTNAEPEKKHQYVLVLRPKANAAKKEPNLEKIGGKELKRWRKGRLIEVPLSALEHLRKDPTVAYLALVNDGSEPEAPTYVIGEAEEEWAMRVEPNGDDTPPLWDSGLYAYDGAGNIKAIGPDTYKYDLAQRLSAAVVGGESLSYTYDSFGNQVQRVIGPAIVPTPTDALTNHLENADYDPAGNQLSKSGYTREYRYDALNMMVERGTGQPTRYIYTADDERIGVQQSSDWSWTIRDFSGKVLSTFESTDLDELWTWSWVESHHYRDGALTSAIKMEERAGNRPGRYFHLDHLGTPRLITDGTGFKISRHDLYPFGKEQTNYTQEVVDWRYNSIEPMKFTGHERDFVTVLDSNRHDYLDYMHARYYNPPLGRFLSVDPVLDVKRALRSPQMWNRYAYVLNNPVRNTDPTGKVVVVQGGSSADRQDMLEYMKTITYNQKAAQYLSVDKFNRLTVKGMSVDAWAKKFGGSGNVSQMAALMQSSHKIGVGFSSDAMTVAKGGGGWAPVSRDYSRVTIDRGSFPQVLGGVTQFVDTTLAHELFGHGMRFAGLLQRDTGTLRPEVALSQFKIMHETDPSGMWAENQYRAMIGDPLRQYYTVPGDYVPPTP